MISNKMTKIANKPGKTMRERKKSSRVETFSKADKMQNSSKQLELIKRRRNEGKKLSFEELESLYPSDYLPKVLEKQKLRLAKRCE